MARVAVKEDVLRWALDRSNTTVDALRSRFPKIGEWLTGASQPTLKQLESLSKATTTPFGMLFLDSPPDEQLPIPHYRTVYDKAVSRPSADLIETVYMAQRRQDWMREYLAENGHQPLSFVASADLKTPIKDVAARLRSVLRFDENWASRHGTWEDALRSLRDAMENAGILVFSNSIVGYNTHRALDPDEFRGFVLVDPIAPVVFVNSADPKVAQMFTLAHELAHVFYGSSAAFDLRLTMAASNRTEQACNRVAAEFLVPEELIVSAWPFVRDNEQRYYLLAKQFKVSTIVVARRLLDLGMIDRDEFRAFYAARMAEQHSARPATGGDFYASLPAKIGNRFGMAVVRAVREGRLLYTDAYSLTGVRGSVFERYASGVDA